MTIATDHSDLRSALQTTLQGEVILPGDLDWDAARRAWQLLVDQQPAAVVVAADADDVATTVRVARALGLRVAPQATGHAAGAIGDLADVILLRTSRLGGVEVRPGAATVRVGAGATWGAVAAAATPHGLAAVSGMAPSVGVVGFVLGGGLGWFARSHGVGANALVALEAVDAQGRIIRIDHETHAELLWAARGGSLPLIVTAVELRLHRLGDLQAGSLLWPIDRAADVAHAWREWIDAVPEGVTSLARVLRYPPIPEIPDVLRGRSFVAVEAALQASAEDVARLLAPLRALEPEMDSIRPMTAAELPLVHGDPPEPAPGFGESVLLAEISAASVDALLDAALAPSAAALVSIELRHLGGAAAPGRGVAGAATSIEGEGLVFAVGIVPAPAAYEAVRAAASAVQERLAPFAAPGLVKNFVERPAAVAALYGAETAARLQGIADDWDSDGLILSAHPLGGAARAGVRAVLD